MKFSVKRQYTVYMAMLHVVLMLLVYKVLFQDKLLFIGSEVFLLLSLIASVLIYRNFMQPIEFVRSGIEAIKDKDFTIKFVPTGKGEVDTLIEVYNLMIDQLREERTRLNEQHFFLEKLIAASPIAIIVLDFDDRIASLNLKARQLFQKQEMELLGVTPAESGIPLLEECALIEDGGSGSLRANGFETFKIRRSHLMDQGFRRSFLMIEELTTEILASEKKAYGKVIRMMAHEVNNTLGATDSILQTARHMFPRETHEDLNDALRIASERNGRLAGFMRNFADVVRLPIPVRRERNADELVRDVVAFMKPLAENTGVSLVFFGEYPVILEADSAQLEQALVNVIKNAIEACTPGCTIEVHLDEERLEIRNNGKPISDAEAGQLFNPFYSSKPDGQGVGLTLTRDILLNHGYGFSLQTEADGWTCFRIRFCR